MTIQEYSSRIYSNAVQKGFYDNINELLSHPALTVEQRDFIRYLWRANRLMLIVSELAEGLEGIRHNNRSAEPGSGGLFEELADAQIRLWDFFASEGVDPEPCVQAKMEYNSKRERMHGGKVA